MTKRKFVKDLLTGIDNETYDVGRLLWVLAFLVGMGLEIRGVLAREAFDLQQFGIGVGALLLAGGASLKIKQGTEPGEKS